MSNNQDQINSKDFLIGTLIGGIVGASIALLWAPKSGRELRTELNEQAQLAKEKGGKLAETAKQKTTVLLDKVKSSTLQDAGEELEEVVEGLDENQLQNDSTLDSKESTTSTEAEEEVAVAATEDVVSEQSEAKAEATTEK